MKKTEQEDALFESNANPVMTESSVENSEDRHIVVNSDNMKMIADFINRVDVLTNPNFKIKAEYVPSKEFKSLITEFSQSAVGVADEMKKYYDSIPERVFEKIRSQIVEEVKNSQSIIRTEVWWWRISFGLFCLVGVLWAVLELMRKYSVESTTEALLWTVGVIVWTCITCRITWWMKN